LEAAMPKLQQPGNTPDFQIGCGEEEHFTTPIWWRVLLNVWRLS